MFARIDARGGPRRDATISLVNIEGPPYCGLVFPDGSGWGAPARQVGRSIKCRFRLSLLKPMKRIRWYVISVPDQRVVVDRAPDAGWYR
jgi:hypothetical protein